MNELKMAISANEINHRETLNIIAEKSKENVYLKNELNNMKQANDAVLDQVKIYIILLIHCFHLTD
jgi:hypothetical protein